MARTYFGIEKNLRIFKKNSDTDFVDHIFGAGAPIGTSGETDEAPIGSLYQDTANGNLYIKKTDTSSAGDWSQFEAGAEADDIEIASPYTPASGDVTDADTVQSALEKIDGNNDAQDSLLGTSQGDTDLGTFTGTTISDNTTVKNALQELETEVELKADASDVTEIDANVDDLITLSGVAENSTDLGTFTGDIIADNQTNKGALQDLETELVDTRDNADDLISLSGVAENSTDYGTFPGDSLADGQTGKELFERIEVLLEQMRGVQVTGITASTAVDSVPHADVKACKWLVEAFEEATPANRKALEVYALTDGSSVDDTVYAKLRVGSNFNLDIDVAINGANMELQAASSTAGVTVTARRIEVVKSVL